jgi:hypothetical protein
MNKTAALLLLLCFVLLTGGAAMLSTAAGVLTAGVLAGLAGVMSLTADKAKDRKGEQ